MEQKPSLGRIVLFRAEHSNGATEHPAIITRVWSDTCVNLTVFPDYAAPVAKSSVAFSDDVDNPNGLYAWRWPPRV
jgi:hypothetical protein